jgi:hypothetical protein
MPSGGIMRARLLIVVVYVCSCLMSLEAEAQGPGRNGGRGGPPPTGQAVAPIDLTGYWVAIVTQDWRWRMVTPARGDYQSVPMTAAARMSADAWDPTLDEAAGEQCKSYGAPALMRVPGRLHITWQDANTLSVETDAGMQTRVFRFGDVAEPQGPPTWQGHSSAQWETPRGRGGGRGARGAAPRFRSLRVVTTHLRPGYLRKNGVPYSGDAVLTEYWNLHGDPSGDQYIVITTLVEDPLHLREPWHTALQFKRESNDANWDPTPCSTRW